MRHKKIFIACFVLSALFFYENIYSQSLEADSSYVALHYIKYEYRIPMRDGAKLFTAVFVPRDTTRDYPIIINRTPYRAAPYGEANYKDLLGPSMLFTKEGYIFVYQDVRGRFMSEGKFENVRPIVPDKKNTGDIDESSDAYDTIDWLVKNIKHNNGRAGIYGFSYPGFYAAAALINAHPALKVASPQAPIGDWFMGDDMHHNGAFCSIANIGFFSVFGKERSELTTKWQTGFKYPVIDGYSYLLKKLTIPNINKNCGLNEIPFWNEVMKHGVYDDYWQKRTPLPHYKNIKPAVITVAGLFDAEDLYGSLATYKTIEKQNPGIYNVLVFGPWSHGQWESGAGDKLGDISFGGKTGEFYREQIEFPVFNHFLKDKEDPGLPEAYVFETGSNVWNKYESWPPAGLAEENIYLAPGGKLLLGKKPENGGYDEYVSNPLKPVPFSKDLKNYMYAEYMVDDQRFAATRPDVLVYESDEMREDYKILGPLEVSLSVSTSSTDADFVVKIIDVFPDTAGVDKKGKPQQMGGFQMLVRGDIIRGKFRNSFEKPEPFVPGEITNVKFTLRDISHCFKKGHRLMAQIQSSWFPLFDINPQKFTDIYSAVPEDFEKAAIKIYNSAEHPSFIKAGVKR
jgi:putative CocE/NonD family hydrolase